VHCLLINTPTALVFLTKRGLGRNLLLNRMFVLVPQRWTLGAKFPKGKYNPHTPRQASGVRRVPAKCCSNTSVRSMQAFGGDRLSRVATQVRRSANPDERSAAAIFFRARKSLVRTGRPPRGKPHLRLRPCLALQCASLLLPWVPNSFVVPIAIIVCHSAFSFCNSIDHSA
jgi:hypothetical protein